MLSFHAEVVPEAPGIGALLLFVVALGLSYIAAPLVRLILGGASTLVGKLPIVGGIVSKPIRNAEDRTVKWLLNKAAAMQGVGVAMFRLWWHQHTWLVREVADLSRDTYHGLRGLDVSLRRWVAQHTGRVQATVPAAKAGAKANTVASVAAQRRWVRAQIRSLYHTIDARIAHAIDVALPGTISIPRPRLGYLERIYRGLRAQVRRHAKLLAGAGAAALVLTALRRLGLGFLRCSKVRRTGKRLCGVDEDLLQSLLADTLIVAGTLSLVEFAKDLQGITGETAGWMRWFWRVSPDKPNTQRG